MDKNHWNTTIKCRKCKNIIVRLGLAIMFAWSLFLQQQQHLYFVNTDMKFIICSIFRYI